MINKIDVRDKYPCCVEKENWEHVLKYSKNTNQRQEFLFTLKEKLLVVEGTDEVVHKVLQIMDDIKNYLESNEYFIMVQDLIRFKNLFCGFILKD